jgi:Glycosyl transferase family 2
MRVSVVIASHNHQAYVGEAIESALAQTHPDVEVIAVDDGSTDASAAIVAGFEANGVRVVLQENRGHAGAVNAGYALATGELVIFLDADDVVLPTAAAAAVATFEEGVAQVQWPLAEIDAQGKATGETTPVAKLSHGDLLEQLLQAGPLQWASSGLGAAWTRRYLELVMPVPEPDFWYGVDAYLVALAPLYGEVRALERPHTLYRRHASNHSARPFDEMISFDTEVARKLFAQTTNRARALGLEVDPASWERTNWSLMAARSLAEIDAVVGRTVPFVLIDGMQLSLEPGSGRRVIPFLEHEGQYWGEPEDDAQAIDELERLRRAGARFLVLAWPSFWWLDDYPQFIEYLYDSYACVLHHERLRIFELAP